MTGLKSITEPKGLNCHYVSKFIVKPWSVTRSKRPSVDFIDVETRRIERKRIENLFSAEGLNSPELESLLNKHIETPIAQYANSVIVNPENQKDNWHLYLALRLLFFVQILRFSELKGDAHPDLSLEELMRKIDEEPNFKEGIIALHDTKFQLNFVRLRQGDFMFYPETGYFAIPIEQKKIQPADGPFCLAWAIPFAPDLILVDVPLNADTTLLPKIFLGQWSTFEFPGSKRYIVPPSLREHFSDDEIISEFFRFRKTVSDTFFMIRTIENYEDLGRRLLQGEDVRDEIQKLDAEIAPRFAEFTERDAEFSGSDFGKLVIEQARKDKDLAHRLGLDSPEN